MHTANSQTGTERKVHQVITPFGYMKKNARLVKVSKYQIPFKKSSVKYNSYLVYSYRLLKMYFLIMFYDFFIIKVKQKGRYIYTISIRSNLHSAQNRWFIMNPVSTCCGWDTMVASEGKILDVSTPKPLKARKMNSPESLRT